jgi:ectoine hydroxylase-related dioxygenase (phytanoyl-CoA dioxygenase family)
MTTVCFLHIPKTSGTSINLYLNAQFRASEICPAQFGEEYASMDAARLARFRFWRAECDASVIELLPPATPVITLLREPFARAYSHWRYIKRLPEHRLHEQFQAEHSTFEHFLEVVPANPMACMLAAPAGGEPRGLWEQPDGSTGEDLFERALARLESFAVVGLTERHDDTVALVAHHMGWAPPARLPVTNAGPRIDGLHPASKNERDIFEERNQIDRRLHAVAAAMFERRWSALDAPTRTVIYERRLAAASSELTHRQVIDMCGPIEGAGWLPPVDTALGPMRPIGVGGEATLDLTFSVARFAKLRLTCPAVSSQEALESLEITVNGAVVPFTRRAEPEGVTLQAAMPPSGPGQRFTRIGFRCMGGVSVEPNHTGARNDIEATVAISRLEVIPFEPSRLRPPSSPVVSRGAPLVRGANFYWRASPAWTFDEDLQRRLDALQLWTNIEDLQRDGYTVVPDVIGPGTVERARALICRHAVASNHRTRRSDVMHPLLIDPLFVDLLVNPVQLALADAACGKGMLDSQVGLVRDRTSNPQGLHAENALWLPAPYPSHHYLCSAMLTLDHFDEANGGTCFVPGSHLTGHDPNPDDSEALTGAVTPDVGAGALIVWLGGTWHGANPRTADGERVSVLTIFTRPSLRPAQDIRGIPSTIATTDELRLRLRRNDIFEQDGWYTGSPAQMLHWIRNTPGDNSLTCEWGETIADATRNGRRTPTLR